MIIFFTLPQIGEVKNLDIVYDGLKLINQRTSDIKISKWNPDLPLLR